MPEIRKCDAPSHLPLRQSSPRSTLGGQEVPLYLLSRGRLLGAALCRGYAAPEVHLQSVQRHSSLACISQSSPATTQSSN